MIFHKLTSAALLSLALTTTARPNLQPSKLVKRAKISVSAWDHDTFDADHYLSHSEYDDHEHNKDDAYWGHDYHEEEWDHEHGDEPYSDQEHTENYWNNDNEHGDDGHDSGYWSQDEEPWDGKDAYYDHGNGQDWKKGYDYEYGYDDDYHPDWENDWSRGWTYDDDYHRYHALNSLAGAVTVYSQGARAGSCGEVHDDNAFIAALGNAWMNGEYMSEECGRQIRVTNLGSFYPVGGEGRSIIVTVKDTCESCDEDHIDLSIAAWNALTDNTDFGLISVAWAFI